MYLKNWSFMITKDPYLAPEAQVLLLTGIDPNGNRLRTSMVMGRTKISDNELAITTKNNVYNIRQEDVDMDYFAFDPTIIVELFK